MFNQFNLASDVAVVVAVAAVRAVVAAVAAVSSATWHTYIHFSYLPYNKDLLIKAQGWYLNSVHHDDGQLFLTCFKCESQ